MVTFTEEILSGKLHFLCSEKVYRVSLRFLCDIGPMNLPIKLDTKEICTLKTVTAQKMEFSTKDFFSKCEFSVKDFFSECDW